MFASVFLAVIGKTFVPTTTRDERFVRFEFLSIYCFYKFTSYFLFKGVHCSSLEYRWVPHRPRDMATDLSKFCTCSKCVLLCLDQ